MCVMYQGLLAGVGSLELAIQDSTISLNWTAPFTLDILLVTPDIEGYCVDIINSTSSLTLYSQCGINTTEFSYPLHQNMYGCHDYIYAVTPINVVGSGKRVTISLSQALERKGAKAI